MSIVNSYQKLVDFLNNNDLWVGLNIAVLDPIAPPALSATQGMSVTCAALGSLANAATTYTDSNNNTFTVAVVAVSGATTMQVTGTQAMAPSGTLAKYNGTGPTMITYGDVAYTNVYEINTGVNAGYVRVKIPKGVGALGSQSWQVTAGYVAQAVTCTSANATVGAVYADNNGNLFTVLATVASSTSLTTSGSINMKASGTLVRQSGTGDATITYSTVANTAVPTSAIAGSGVAFAPSSSVTWPLPTSGGPGGYFLVDAASSGNVIDSGAFAGTVGTIVYPNSISVFPTLTQKDLTLGI